MTDTERIDWLERLLNAEIYYHDVILQSDTEDGIWVALRSKGSFGNIPTEGQESRAGTLREALDNAAAKAAREVR